jgi:hypothetical protein
MVVPYELTRVYLHPDFACAVQRHLGSTQGICLQEKIGLIALIKTSSIMLLRLEYNIQLASRSMPA